MIDAIEQIANTAPAPITKKELKKKLSGAGYGEDRLGAYFYTAIMRLKQKRKIAVLPDGRIGRPVA
jgi:hypothetical protein